MPIPLLWYALGAAALLAQKEAAKVLPDMFVPLEFLIYTGMPKISNLGGRWKIETEAIEWLKYARYYENSFCCVAQFEYEMTDEEWIATHETGADGLYEMPNDYLKFGMGMYRLVGVVYRQSPKSYLSDKYVEAISARLNGMGLRMSGVINQETKDGLRGNLEYVKECCEKASVSPESMNAFFAALGNNEDWQVLMSEPVDNKWSTFNYNRTLVQLHDAASKAVDAFREYEKAIAEFTEQANLEEQP